MPTQAVDRVNSTVAMLDVLMEVVGAVKIGIVARPELVNLPQMSETLRPVLVGWKAREEISTQGIGAIPSTGARKLFTAVTTDVGLAGSVGGFMEGSCIVIVRQGRAGPSMTSDVT